MGQEEIIKFLKKSEMAMSRSEIAKAVNQDPNTVSFLLNKLLKHGEVLFEEIDRIKAWEKFGCKRRMRLYKAR